MSAFISGYFRSTDQTRRRLHITTGNMEHLHPSDMWRHVLDDSNATLTGWRILVARDPTNTNCITVAFVSREPRGESNEQHTPYMTFFHYGTDLVPCRCANINRYLLVSSSGGGHRSLVKILQARDRALQMADTSALHAARKLAERETGWGQEDSIWHKYESAWYDILRKLLRPDTWLATPSTKLRMYPGHYAHDISVNLVLGITGALTPIKQGEQFSSKLYDGFCDPRAAERSKAYCPPIPTSQWLPDEGHFTGHNTAVEPIRQQEEVETSGEITLSSIQVRKRPSHLESV